MTRTTQGDHAIIVDAVRTPIGRHGGALASVRPDDLAALVIGAIVERTGIDATIIDDVILGCTNQAGEDNRNVARMATLIAGLPETVPGQTVNRLCASGLQAIASAAQAVAGWGGGERRGGGGGPEGSAHRGWPIRRGGGVMRNPTNPFAGRPDIGRFVSWLAVRQSTVAERHPHIRGRNCRKRGGALPDFA